MLEKDPSDRYQSPDELLQALLHLFDAEPPVRPSRRVRPPVESPAADTPPPWRMPALSAMPAAQRPAEPADPRAAAAGQYERAKVVMATDNQELTYAHELLVSCCRLDPDKTSYRKTLRQVGRALQREKRWGRWLAPMGALAAKAKLQYARAAGDHAKVLEYGEEVLALAPDDVATQLNMVEAARSLGLKKLSIWTLEELCKQDPEDTDLLRLLGRAYERDEETDKALSVWSAVLRLLPYDLEAGRKVDKLSIAGTLRRGSLGP
jgi:tetratricopeptide (TPR) repeat protein